MPSGTQPPLSGSSEKQLAKVAAANGRAHLRRDARRRRSPPVSAETLEWNKNSSSELWVGKSGGSHGSGSHGSDDALPEMRKTNGPGCHHLRPHRPPVHRL